MAAAGLPVALDHERALGVGIVGAGFAGRAHVEAARRSGLARTIAISEASPDLAGAVARQLQVDAYTSDYHALLADESIDVVHVCVPNALHAEVSAAALEAGKHVISEKPLGVSSGEATALRRLADATGRVNAVCFNYRFYPLVREARARIADGTLGTPILAHGSYLQDWLLLESDYNWRVGSTQGGRSRAVADIGSHWADLLTFVLGRPVTDVLATFGRLHDKRRQPSVEGETFTSNGSQGELVEITTEDFAFLLLRLEGGLHAQALVSQVSAGAKNALRLQVDGTDAALRWEQERPEELWIGYRSSPNELRVKDPALLSPESRAYASLPGGHPEGWHDALTKLVRSVYGTVLGSARPDFPTFADGLAAVRVVDAALASAESGTWQPVDRDHAVEHA